MRENVGSAKTFSNKLISRPGIGRKAIGHSCARGYSGIRVVKVKDEDKEPPAQARFYRDD
jgi:hypothetical protein